ncbi:hypothetical protein ILYODFUR_023060 [Ilyodon furcidens]|uniref:Uncharacterized protein n=1 Tax=Ilyodon furcidens TaxID=33524 RepID=A0ABV0U8V2_9TELE
MGIISKHVVAQNAPLLADLEQTQLSQLISQHSQPGKLLHKCCLAEKTATTAFLKVHTTYITLYSMSTLNNLSCFKIIKSAKTNFGGLSILLAVSLPPLYMT